METKPPVQNFVRPEDALESGNFGAETPVSTETSINIPERASRDEVIDAFISNQVALADQLDETRNQPGFNLDANEIIAKRREETDTQQQLDAAIQEWANLGGNEIEDAQKAVDELNFKSTAEDRVIATNHLRDAKNALFENYTAQQTKEVVEQPEDNPSEPTSQIITESSPGENDAETTDSIGTESLSPDQPEVNNTLEDSGDTPIKGIDPAEARANWHNMMKNERKAAAAEAEPTAYRTRELGSSAVDDLLSDSDVVKEYRDRRSKRRSLFSQLNGSFAKWRMNSEFKKMQKMHANETKAFDRAADKEKAAQAATDKIEMASAMRADAHEQRQDAKKVAFEARQKAQAERFESQEAKRLARRKAIGRMALRT